LRARPGTDAFEIICYNCGDDPDLDYRDVSPDLQRIRGPYPIAAGVAAYKEHVERHPPAGPGRQRRRRLRQALRVCARPRAGLRARMA
jgi:hypothetical protein